MWGGLRCHRDVSGVWPTRDAAEEVVPPRGGRSGAGRVWFPQISWTEWNHDCLNRGCRTGPVASAGGRGGVYRVGGRAAAADIGLHHRRWGAGPVGGPAHRGGGVGVAAAVV